MEHLIQNAGTYLLLEISGAPSIAEVRVMLAELLEQARATGLKRVLAQAKVAKDLDLVATKLAVEELPRLGFAPDFRIAILLLDEQARRSAQFAVEVAESRGIAMRTFSGREAALRWLLA